MLKSLKMSTPVKYGILLSLLSQVMHTFILFTAGEYSTTAGIASYLYHFLNALAIFLAVYAIRKAERGFITFSKAFKSGMKLISVLALITISIQLLRDVVFYPGGVEERIEKVTDRFEKSIAAKHSVVSEKTQSIGNKVILLYRPVPFAILKFVVYMVTGSLFSLISALILKRDPPFQPGQDQPVSLIEGDFDPYR